MFAVSDFCCFVDPVPYTDAQIPPNFQLLRGPTRMRTMVTMITTMYFKMLANASGISFLIARVALFLLIKGGGQLSGQQLLR